MSSTDNDPIVAVDLVRKLRGYCDDVRHCIANLDLTDIVAAALVIATTKGTIYTAGNGGSAANASHLAGHLQILGYNARCLNDNISAFSAAANDTSYESSMLEIFRPCNDDMFISLSTSGASHNVCNAQAHAKHNGAKTLSILGGKPLAVNSRYTPHQSILCGDLSAPQVEDIHSLVIHMIAEVVKERRAYV